METNVISKIRNLSAYDEAALKEIFSGDVDFIDAPVFHADNAKEILFDSTVLPAIPVWRLEVDEDNKQGKAVVLTQEQEVKLFQRFNYARFMVSKIKSGLTENVDQNEVKEMLVWHKKAIEIRNYIVQVNMRLVISMIRHYYEHRIDMDEVISEGYIYLIAAANKFDFGRNYKFSTYAYWAIVRAWGKSRKKNSKRTEFAPVSLDDHLENNDPAEDNHRSEAAFMVESIRRVVEKNLADLTDDELKIIQLRYLGDNGKKTIEEISDKLSIRKYRVAKLEKSALSKMKAALTKEFMR